MKILKAMILFLLAGILVSCAAREKVVKKSEKDMLNLLNVSADTSVFDPAKNEQVKVRYYVSKPALVTIRIYDASEALVRVLGSAGSGKQGYNEQAWDGRDDSGALVANDVYVYTVESSVPATQEKYTYDPTDSTGGQEVSASDVRFDAQNNTIRYRLPVPASVRVRIGMKDGGPLLRTLINWEPQSAGPQALSWDGWDDSRVVNEFSGSQLLASVVAYSLPDNAVIVRSKPSEPWSSAADRPLRPAADGAAEANTYGRQSLKEKTPPGFDLAFINSAGAMVQEDVPVISTDNVAARVTLSDADKLRLISSRFEVLFFLDNAFLIEEEEGTSPLNYTLDLNGVNQGEHVLTVNVVGFPDRIASRSKRFVVHKRTTQ